MSARPSHNSTDRFALRTLVSSSRALGAVLLATYAFDDRTWGLPLATFGAVDSNSWPNAIDVTRIVTGRNRRRADLGAVIELVPTAARHVIVLQLQADQAQLGLVVMWRDTSFRRHESDVWDRALRRIVERLQGYQGRRGQAGPVGRAIVCRRDGVQAMTAGLRDAVESQVFAVDDLQCMHPMICAGGLSVTVEPLDGLPGDVSIVSVLRLAPPTIDPANLLTGTQQKIADAAASGATCPEIARSFGVGVETVRSHMKEIYRRLDIASRVELVELFTAR